MSAIAEIETVSRTLVETPRDKPVRAKRVAKLTTALRCMVLSEDDSRLQLLVGAVADAGYEPVACSDVSNAWLNARQDELHLAFVDLATATDEGSVRDFSEHLAKDRQILVAVCGTEEQPLEEIWARQMGAWLYLPGLANRKDLCSLCDAARPVVERLINR